jgi:hypothetical protein
LQFREVFLFQVNINIDIQICQIVIVLSLFIQSLRIISRAIMHQMFGMCENRLRQLHHYFLKSQILLLPKTMPTLNNFIQQLDNIGNHLRLTLAWGQGLASGGVDMDPYFKFIPGIYTQHLSTHPHTPILLHQLLKTSDNFPLLLLSLCLRHFHPPHRQNLVSVYVVD